MSALIHRRCAFQVRRDASETLSNGRIRYDALFSRWGVQLGPDGVEYRSQAEVFDAASLATLAQLPGVLLHPDSNFGTNFGEGSYPVRGVTSESVVMHEDGIHTSGTILVRDDEWNAAIASGEVADLSLGYSILADETPGAAPSDAPGVEEFGADYILSHTKIVGDHCAGVPEGNAGTARVVADAVKFARCTKLGLAAYAAARMDARPMTYDLGSWNRRQPKQDSQPMTLKQFIEQFPRMDAKQRRDAWVDIYGESNDPDMIAVMAALGGASTTPAAPAAPAPAPVADAEEEDPPEEEEKTPPPTEGEEEPEEEEDAEEGESKMDARDRREGERSDVLEVARRVFGNKYQRSDAKGYKRLTADQIRSAVVAKLDAKASERVDKLDAKQQATGTALEFSRLRDVVDAAPDFGAELVKRINATRGDTATGDAQILDLAAKIKKIQQDAASQVRGANPAKAK